MSDRDETEEPPRSAPTDAVVCARASVEERRSQRLEELWGPEPAYATQPEDTQFMQLAGCGWLPSPMRFFFFTWAGSRVYKAARETMAVEDLLGPVRAACAYTNGRRLSECLHTQWVRRHRWDGLLGERVSVQLPRRLRRSDGTESSTGLLAFVGPVVSYDHTSQWAGKLFAGVVWDDDVPLSEGPAGTDTPWRMLRPGQRAHAEAVAGWLHPKHLATIEERDRQRRQLPRAAPLRELCASYVPVGSVRFFESDGVAQPHDGSAAEADGETVIAVQPHADVRRRAAYRAGDEVPLVTVAPPQAMSALGAMYRALGSHLWRLGGWRFLTDAALTAAPLVLEQYVAYLTDDGPREEASPGAGPHPPVGPDGAGVAAARWHRGLGIIALFFAVSFIHSVAQQKYTQLCYRAFYTLRAALSAVIFEKALCVEAKSLEVPGLHVGRIVNLLTNDVEQLEQVALLFWPTMSVPFVVSAAFYLIYRMVGMAVVVGFGLSLLFIPVQVLLTCKVYACYGDLARAADARVKATNEFLSGVRTAKFMSWEPIFLEKIQALRERELQLTRRAQVLWTVLSLVTDTLPSVITATLFATYFFSGHELTPRVIYPTLSLIGLLCVPFRLIPIYANWLSMLTVSIHRLTAFLERPDADDNTGGRQQLPWAALQSARATAPTAAEREAWLHDAVEYRHATITAYSASTQDRAVPDGADGGAFVKPVDVLTDISLKIPRGKLTVILGPTGSGKTSLLTALIGAVEVTAGTVLVRENDAGSTAFVPERPWLMDATVEENILFFGDRDEARLQRALHCTQLADDIPALPDGLWTQVGEKGITLSGGQQARLGLARAVYADRDLYLLDDPLSAVDARVGQRIVEQCVLGELRGKTRVLATHQTAVAQFADLVVVLGAGGVVEFSGAFKEYKAYARDSAYRGRRSGFVEYSAALLPLTRPSSITDLDDPRATGQSGSGLRSPSSTTGRLVCAEDDAPRGSAGAAAAVTRERSELLARESLQSRAAIESLLATESAMHSPLSSAVARMRVRSPTSPRATGEAPLPPPSPRSAVAEEKDGAVVLQQHSEPPRRASLAEEESRARGGVPMSLYRRYVRACGGQSALTVLVGGYCLSECLAVSAGVWLSVWAYSRERPHDGDDRSNISTAATGLGAGSDGHLPLRRHPHRLLPSDAVCVYIYLVLVAAGALCTPVRYLVSFAYLRRGCRVLHDNLLTSVSRATLAFFDACPHGRLLNRFSRDVKVTDGQLPNVVIAFAGSAAYLASSILLMVFSQYVTLLLIVPFLFVFYQVNNFNCAAVRTLQRLDNVATTPVVSFLAETLAGKWTVAAFRRTPSMLREALRRVDMKFSSSYSIVVIQVWVGLRLNLLSTALLTAIALIGVLSKHVSWLPVNVALISLTITNSSSFTAVLSRVMDTAAALEASMSSVERIVQFTDTAPQEGGGFFDASEDAGLSPSHGSGTTHTLEAAAGSATDGAADVSAAAVTVADEQAALRMSTLQEEDILFDEEESLPSSQRSARWQSHTSRLPRGAHGSLPSSAISRRVSVALSTGGSAVQARRVAAAAAAHRATGCSSPLRGPYEATAGRRMGGAAAPTMGGTLELQHVFLRYRPSLPLVLNDLTFSVCAGQRVGVVGRTGSGKSSLMLTLMRLVDTTSGRVLVDGREVSQYNPVSDLRQLFAIIPQEPVLFDGSIRSNLDPLGEATDKEVWAALELVGMADSVRAAGTPAAAGGALAVAVTEGGRNFSVGQRQLLCLARAIGRRHSRFLLMDEATASVDAALDQRIQTVLASHFAQHTILSIAHRLHTVATYDQILMLDAGRVVCCGSPAELLAQQNPPSPFAELLRASGDDVVRLFKSRMRGPSA